MTTDTTTVQLVWSTPREIAATGQVVDPGDTADVPTEVAEQLLEQPDVWATPTKPRKTTKAGKTGTKAEEADR